MTTSPFDENTTFSMPIQYAFAPAEIDIANDPIVGEIVGKIDSHYPYGTHRYSSRMCLFVTERDPHTNTVQIKSLIMVVNRIPYILSDLMFGTLPLSQAMDDVVRKIPSKYINLIRQHETTREFLTAMNLSYYIAHRDFTEEKYKQIRTAVLGLLSSSDGRTIIAENSIETINFPGGMPTYVPRKRFSGFRMNIHSAQYIPPRTDGHGRKIDDRAIDKYRYNMMSRPETNLTAAAIISYNVEPPTMTALRETNEEMYIDPHAIQVLIHTNKPSTAITRKSTKFISSLCAGIEFRTDIMRQFDNQQAILPAQNSHSMFVGFATSKTRLYYSFNYIGFINRMDLPFTIPSFNTISTMPTGMRGSDSGEISQFISIPIKHIMNIHAGKLDAASTLLDIHPTVVNIIASMIKQITIGPRYTFKPTTTRRLRRVELAC